MSLARALTRPLGIDVTRWPPRSAVSVHVATLLAELRVDCVLDVGARRGEFATALRGAGYGGRLVSFEPVSTEFERLAHAAARDDEWRVLRLALGDRAGTQRIHVAEDTALSSFREPSATGREVYPGSQAETRAEEVEVARLDDVFSACVAGLAEPRAFLKLDTQGWDLEVLAGGAESLRQVVGLQVELAVRPLYEGAPDYLEALARLRELGYAPTGFFPVARAGITRLLELDCVLARA